MKGTPDILLSNRDSDHEEIKGNYNPHGHVHVCRQCVLRLMGTFEEHDIAAHMHTDKHVKRKAIENQSYFNSKGKKLQT